MGGVKGGLLLGFVALRVLAIVRSPNLKKTFDVLPLLNPLFKNLAYLQRELVVPGMFVFTFPLHEHLDGVEPFVLLGVVNELVEVQLERVKQALAGRIEHVRVGEHAPRRVGGTGGVVNGADLFDRREDG